MKRSISMKRRIWLAALCLAVIAAIAGGLFYHHYEYAPIVHPMPGGGNITISRHNFNQLSPANQQAILHPVDQTKLHLCPGNPQDQCLGNESIDFWPSGSEGASNPDLQQPTGKDVTPSEIMGRIASSSGNTIQIKTSSGRLFTIEYPIDTIANFNINLASGYGFSIGVGDELYVIYYSADAHKTTITTPQIARSSILIKTNGKAGPISKY